MSMDFPQSLIRRVSREDFKRLRRYTARITNLQYDVGTSISSDTFDALSNPDTPFEWHLMWPELKTLSWLTSGENLKFMRYFLPHGVHNLEINLEGAPTDEARKALSMVRVRCKNLREIRLFDRKMAEDEDTQNTTRGIVCNNARTLRVFCSPRGSRSSLVDAVLKLPKLEMLEMHDPEIGMHDPETGLLHRAPLPSLERLVLTLEEAHDIPCLLGNIRESKLRTFVLRTPYPVSKEDLDDLTALFKRSDLYRSLNMLSWQPPRNDQRPPTWEFVATLTPFVNMHTLVLSARCDGTCRFRFRHEHVVELSRQMPQLRYLNFGGRPCANDSMSTDIGFDTLTELAHNCPDLSRLTVHFNPDRFIRPAGRVKPNRNVSHWDVGNAVLPADPMAPTLIAMWAAELFPNAAIIGDMRADAPGWQWFFAEFAMLLAASPICMPFGL